MAQRCYRAHLPVWSDLLSLSCCRCGRNTERGSEVHIFMPSSSLFRREGGVCHRDAAHINIRESHRFSTASLSTVVPPTTACAAVAVTVGLSGLSPVWPLWRTTACCFTVTDRYAAACQSCTVSNRGHTSNHSVRQLPLGVRLALCCAYSCRNVWLSVAVVVVEMHPRLNCSGYHFFFAWRLHKRNTTIVSICLPYQRHGYLRAGRLLPTQRDIIQGQHLLRAVGVGVLFRTGNYHGICALECKP